MLKSYYKLPYGVSSGREISRHSNNIQGWEGTINRKISYLGIIEII